jgi:hypothetical protein
MRLVTSTLVVAPHLGTLTMLVGTLRELTTRRGRVHIAVLEDPPPGVDVSAFAGPVRRLTFGRLPALDRWSHLSATVRAVLDCWRWLEPETPDPRAFARALAEAPPLAARLATNALLRGNLLRGPVTRLLRLIHDAIPSPPPVLEFLQAYRPGILVVAPMFSVGSIIPEYLRAANELGIPTIALPDRWDDLSARAWPHVVPDCIALWNREQRRQALETLGLPQRRTAIVGACLPLDAADAVSTTRESFCQRHGLDPSRAIVLLSVGSSEAGRLPAVRQAIDRLRDTADARVRDAVVIVYWPPPAGVQQREHPTLTEPVIPRAETDPAEYASEIAEALVHADVVVADTMTLVLEAAARARPVVALINGVADQELARFCAEFTKRGWPRVAEGLAALDSVVAAALREGLDRAGQAAARTIVRPHGPELSPGFLMYVRLFTEISDRRAAAAPRLVPRSVLWVRRAITPLANWAARRASVLPARRAHAEAVRILIGAPSAASLALHQPLVRVLAERGHQLALVFTSRRSQEAQAYERIKCDVPNIVRAGVLAPPVGMWADVSQALLGLSAYLSVLERRKSGAVAQWLVQFGLTVLPVGMRPIARIARQARGLQRRLRRLAASFDRAIPASVESQQLLAQHAPDAVLTLPDSDLVTAYDSAAAQADLIRGASSLGIPTASIAVGPDAQLHATLVQHRPSRVLVWNDEQRATVLRDVNLAGNAVIVSGASSLDRAVNDPPVMSEQEFRSALGLPPEAPFALLCGSAGVLSDPRREVDLVRRWVTSLRESQDPLLRDLPLLIRRPVHSPRWRTLDFSDLGPVVFGPRRYEASGELDVVLLGESVRYAAVVIGIDALTLTMAAVMGKRAIAISRADAGAADETPIEFLWNIPGSSVSYAKSLDDLNGQLRKALKKPDASAANPFTTTLPVVLNGRRACDIAADAVERLGRQTQRRTQASVGFGAVVMRVPLLAAAGAVSLTGRLLRLGRDETPRAKDQELRVGYDRRDG